MAIYHLARFQEIILNYSLFIIIIITYYLFCYLKYKMEDCLLTTLFVTKCVDFPP